MRLIDAHKVQMKLSEECQNIRYFDKDRKKPQIFADGIDFAWVMLDNQPTVEAIPIEWLMKKADEWATKDITYDGKPFTAQQVGLAIASMVIDWEKENEIQNKKTDNIVK